jgi:hypothetical protein
VPFRVHERPIFFIGVHRGDVRTISLLNKAGLKVDGVAYTKADAAKEGRRVVFS